MVLAVPACHAECHPVSSLGFKESAIPNAEDSIPRESRALADGALATGRGVLDLRVLRPEWWGFDRTPGFAAFIASRPAEAIPFTEEDALGAFSWLRDQLPLALAVGDSGGQPPDLPERVADFLNRFGAVTERDPDRTDPGRVIVERRATELIIKSRFPSLFQEGPLAPSTGLMIPLIRILPELIRLRLALEVVFLLRRGRPQRALNLLDSSEGPLLKLIRDSWPGRGAPDSKPEYLVTHWLAIQLGQEGLRAQIHPTLDGRPARVALQPSTALDFLWLILGVTAAAVEPPFAGLGVHECDYCGRLFVGDRSGVRGSRVFCSPRHGKSYHAREITRRKRAEQRRARDARGGQSDGRHRP